MKQLNIKNKYMIIGFILLFIGLLSISYGFFNYTRTGAINNLGTGRISFNTTESNTLNITNLFPMTSSRASEANLDSVTITITGDTTYTDGEEYEISLVNVENTINGKEIPINYIATYSATTGNTIGTSSNDYWNDREDKDASIYTLNTTGKISEGKQVLVGYIDNGATGINGTLTISAYIDADRIAVSDTYYENAPTPSPTSSPLNSPNDDYGTTTEWVDGRVVLTTSEWNSLGSTPISFKIRAESNEGLWTEERVDPGEIKSCPGCKFMFQLIDPSDYSTRLWTTWNMGGWDDINDTPAPLPPTVITEGLYDDYRKLISETGLNHFLGVILNSNNEVTNAYGCGVKDNEPFCIEGTADGSKHADNTEILQSKKIYNNTCMITSYSAECYDSITSGTFSDGNVVVGTNEYQNCGVDPDGNFACIDLSDNNNQGN